MFQNATILSSLRFAIKFCSVHIRICIYFFGRYSLKDFLSGCLSHHISKDVLRCLPFGPRFVLFSYTATFVVDYEGVSPC